MVCLLPDPPRNKKVSKNSNSPSKCYTSKEEQKNSIQEMKSVESEEKVSCADRRNMTKHSVISEDIEVPPKLILSQTKGKFAGLLKDVDNFKRAQRSFTNASQRPVTSQG